MIKNLTEQQNESKHADFAKSLSAALLKNNIESSPAVVARAFNKQSKGIRLKPHTVRKWLLGVAKPRTQNLILLAQWLKLESHHLLANRQRSKKPENLVSFEFEFIDQEAISHYLAMTIEQKTVVRLVIDAIVKKHR